MPDEIEHEKEFKFLTSDYILMLLNFSDDFVGFKPVKREKFQQTDSYYDTRDLFFFHNNYQLRIREIKGQPPKATLKTPSLGEDDAYERTEHSTNVLEIPENSVVPVFDLSLASPKLEMLLVQLVGRQKLFLSLRAINNRQVIYLNNNLEIFLDRITFRHPQHTTLHQECEVEIEDHGAPAGQLSYLAQQLQGRYNLQPSPDPKYQRGLAKFLK